ncbi:MAG: cupin domain-containing protein [Solirubrobacteraceae bacterium]|nr:cupin domain-containing protein [Solirubrobacteraceae bacterium]
MIELVEDPTLRMRYRFRTIAATAPGGRDVLEVEQWIDPGGGVTPHRHPSMEERFEVLDGTVEFLAGRRWTAASAGERVVIAAGVRHAFRNRSDAVAHVICHADPGLTLQPFLEDAAALGRAGLTTRRAMPRSLDALLQAAVLAEQHRAMVTLLFPPLPPPALQRLLLPVLARWGRRRGHRPGQLGDRPR